MIRLKYFRLRDSDQIFGAQYKFKMTILILQFLSLLVGNAENTTPKKLLVWKIVGQVL